ncbi:hypothetical protein [Bacteroides intestinalis]|jgi:hypothetical protein|uniref:hypothetical protein n=1 Tax=Bacteroides intestinalis TaxID=329854 RepID=UPI00189D8562|nr:hypothetical protein [Bacteroides intestinalis]DAO58305.1 MAG TPA: hypothetical protein [Caudoviricetes sp.]
MEESNNKKSFSLMDYFIDLLNRFMGKKSNYETDKKFFEDEKNLYDAKGKPTPAYQQKMKEYEKYLHENNMSDFLLKNEVENESDQLVLSTTCDYLDRRRELMDKYEKEEKKQRANFKPSEWALRKAQECGNTPQEKEKLATFFEELLADEALVPLEDTETREKLGTLLTELQKED